FLILRPTLEELPRKNARSIAPFGNVFAKADSVSYLLRLKASFNHCRPPFTTQLNEACSTCLLSMKPIWLSIGETSFDLRSKKSLRFVLISCGAQRTNPFGPC